MRGNDNAEIPTFFLFDIETRLPQNHPIRKIKQLVDPVLERLSPEFDKIYSSIGRPSIPPEHLLRAMVLQTLFSIRSERLLVEEIEFHLAYRWFVGLPANEPVWDATVFSKNRERLLKSNISEKFFGEIRKIIDKSGLASDEHFSVDGTLLEAWASMKSFQNKSPDETRDDKSDDDPGNPTVDFKGEKRCNATHESKTDPDSRLIRKGKGKEAKLVHEANTMIENRHGLVMEAKVVQASGTSEIEAALAMADAERKRKKNINLRITVGADKKYDQAKFVTEMRKRNVVVHVAQREDRTSAIDGRTTRHPGYVISQKKRKRIEEVFGWLKMIGGCRRLMYRGIRRISWMFMFRVAVYNLVRLNTLGVKAG